MIMFHSTFCFCSAAQEAAFRWVGLVIGWLDLRFESWGGRYIWTGLCKIIAKRTILPKR
jgi:hypothetical protein